MIFLRGEKTNREVRAIEKCSRVVGTVRRVRVCIAVVNVETLSATTVKE